MVDYLQGGQGGASFAGGQPPPPPPPDIYMSQPRGSNNATGDDSGFGLPPSLVTAMQNGFAPDSQPSQNVASGGVDLSQLGTHGPDGTPGGRPAVPDLPPSIANAIQSGFQPAAQPDQPSPVAQSLSKIAAPSMDSGTLPTPPGASPAAPTTPAPLVPGQSGVPTVDPKTGKPWTPAAFAAYQNSPEGLAQRADQQNFAALDKERQANADASSAEQAQNDATAAAIQASNARQAEQDKVHAAKQAQYQSDVDKYSQQYAQQIKDAANFKVDTDRHVSNAGLIAIALSGIGNALDHQHGPNAAYDILEKNVDKRIADQWAQKKALGEQAEQTKSVLGVARANFDNDRQAQQMQRASERDQLANDLRLTAAQTANPMVKARAEAAAAKLDASGAQIVMGEAQRKAAAIQAEQEQKYKQAELGLRAQGQADARRQWESEYALKVAQLQAAGNAEQAKQLQAQGEAVNDRGMFLPTGTVNKDGIPEQKPITNQDGQPWIAPKDAAKDLGEKKAATEDFVQNIDALRKMRSNFSTADQFQNWAMSSEEGRALMQRYAQAIISYHKATGINRLSGEAVDLTEKVASGGRDPDSVKSVLGLLDNGRQIALDSLYNDLHGKGNYTGSRQRIYEAFPDPLRAPSTPEDRIDQLGRQASGKEFGERHEAPLTFGTGTAGTDVSKQAGESKRIDAVNQLEKMATGTTGATQQRAIATLRDQAANGTAAVKAAAQESLDRMGITSGITFDDQPGGQPATSTARISPDEVIGRKNGR